MTEELNVKKLLMITNKEEPLEIKIDKLYLTWSVSLTLTWENLKNISRLD
jgi:hypothetical protein